MDDLVTQLFTEDLSSLPAPKTKTRDASDSA
jgi:hypothetical protein